MHRLRSRLFACLAVLAVACVLVTPATAQNSGGEKKANTGTQVQAQKPPSGPVELAAAHILVQYVGSTRAGANITRTKEEAMAFAQELTKRARGGEDFAALAKENSDGPSGPNGGDLGTFQSNQMVPEFSNALLTMAIGGISDPVETQFGFHVIKRNKPVPVEKAGARHILIAYKGAMRADPSIERSKSEAYTRAKEVMDMAKKGDKSFEDLAREYSDGPTSTRGGDLGVFQRGRMVPAFDTAVFGMDVGGVSEVVETDFGFHVIQRYQ